MTYIMPSLYREIREYLAKYLPHYVIPFDLTVRSGLRIFETGLKRNRGVVISKTGKKYKRKTERVTPLAYYPMGDRCAIEFKGKRGVKRIVPTIYSEEELREWYSQRNPRTIIAYIDVLKRNWGIGSHDGRRTFCINFFQIFGSDFESQQNLIAITGHKSIVQTEPYLREWRALRMAGVFTKEVMEEIRQMMAHIQV